MSGSVSPGTGRPAGRHDTGRGARPAGVVWTVLAVLFCALGMASKEVMVVAPILVLLSEITPKVLAYRFNVGWARIAVWPLTGPAFAGAVADPVEAWLRCGPVSVRHTVVDGRPIVLDGRLVSPRVEEMLAALDHLVAQGKVRYIGASSMYAWQFQRLLSISERNGWARFVSMQNHYNLVYREEEREMMPLCREEQIAVTPYSPLASGRGARPRSETTTRLKTDHIFIRILFDLNFRIPIKVRQEGDIAGFDLDPDEDGHDGDTGGGGSERAHH